MPFVNALVRRAAGERLTNGPSKLSLVTPTIAGVDATIVLFFGRHLSFLLIGCLKEIHIYMI